MPSIKITNINRKFECESGDTLLRSALRNNIDLSYECNSGGCGACKIKVISGQVENIFPDAPGLSERDKRKHSYLACQCVPISEEVDITAPFLGEIPDDFTPRKFNGRLIGKTPIAENLIEFEFVLEDRINYRPGQYFMVDIPGVGERAYSSSSISEEYETIKFIIKKMPNGKGSSYLFENSEMGEVFKIDGPYGHAHLSEDSSKNIICIAGGSGLSPIVSIVRHLNNKADNKQNIKFYYGVRKVSELNYSFIKEISENLGEKFDFVPALSEFEDSWKGQVGFIHDVVDKEEKNFREKDYYFCGPPAMTSAVQKLLMIEKNVPYDQLHFDRFF